MGRLLTISLVLTSLPAVPVLCVAGVVTHACECFSEALQPCETDCNHETDHGHETRCGHESECPDDPCSIRAVRPHYRSDDVVGLSHAAPAAGFNPATVKHLLVESDFTSGSEFRGAKKLPYPPSDLPLLI